MRDSAGNRVDDAVPGAVLRRARVDRRGGARAVRGGRARASSSPTRSPRSGSRRRCRPAGCPSWTCWSARRARSGCRTSCSGRRPTPSCTSPRRSGPTSARPSSTQALESYRRPRAPLRPHARADPQRRLRPTGGPWRYPNLAPAPASPAVVALPLRRGADPVARAARASARWCWSSRRWRCTSTRRITLPGAAARLRVGVIVLGRRRSRPALYLLPGLGASSGCWRRSSRRRRWCCSTPATSRPPARGWASRCSASSTWACCRAPLALLQRDAPHGRAWVLLAIALTFGNDTGAYFAGRGLGRHKLYPAVSPAQDRRGRHRRACWPACSSCWARARRSFPG